MRRIIKVVRASQLLQVMSRYSDRRCNDCLNVALVTVWTEPRAHTNDDNLPCYDHRCHYSDPLLGHCYTKFYSYASKG